MVWFIWFGMGCGCWFDFVVGRGWVSGGVGCGILGWEDVGVWVLFLFVVGGG